MLSILVALASSLLITLFLTPKFIKFSVRKQMGQFIRKDGPTSHETKRGTPTMGGVVIIIATICGWLLTALLETRMPRASVWLLAFLFVGLGAIGFLDDFIKISKQRSLGLNPQGKIIGQLAIGSIFAIAALAFPNTFGVTPASTTVSLFWGIDINFALWGIGIATFLFILWSNFLITAWSNAVNLTDGLDGLATGVSAFVFAAYTFITLWETYQSCFYPSSNLNLCYDVRDPRDLAIFSAALVGACVGFLWWNASPAQIFMGDTGSLALGGALAGLSILSHTEIIALIIGGVFVAEVFSVVVQVTSFKLTGKRVFKMTPLHHHFELMKWKEVTIVIRFWIIASLCAGLGVGLFYGQWLLR